MLVKRGVVRTIRDGEGALEFRSDWTVERFAARLAERRRMACSLTLRTSYARLR